MKLRPPPTTSSPANWRFQAGSTSDRFPLDLITTHRFKLEDTHEAIKAVGGSGDVIHVSLMPWL